MLLTETFRRFSSSLIDAGLHRQRDLSQAEDEASICFNSNDYLSLANDERIKKAYQRGFERFSTGSGGSMVVCGYHPIHQSLERVFCDALNAEDCLIFSSGYAANLSIMLLLSQFEVPILIDKASHASIYDGVRYSGLEYERYHHNDLIDLEKKLTSNTKPTVVMTESVFSMSGQSAPLKAITQKMMYGCHHLLVDEAHAFGVFGPSGLGAIAAHDLTLDQVPLRVIPFGKAMVGNGAVVVGKGVWIDALLQVARAHIYSTAMSPAIAYGLLETFEVIKKLDDRRTKLFELINYFRQAVKRSPLTWGDSCSPIQQLQLGCPEKALNYAKRLKASGIVSTAMRQPTVSKLQTGLRIILNYHHEAEHIDALFRCLHES